MLVNNTRAFRVLATVKEQEKVQSEKFLHELPDCVLRELEEEVLKVFVEALCFKSKEELLRHCELRKIVSFIPCLSETEQSSVQRRCALQVIVWTDKGASAQYVHIDSPLNKNRDCTDLSRRAFFVLIHCDPSEHERKVG